eukprot:TRINITY_DN6667_c0_g1_i9.p1 TRINITY_DN6667_c0_g1~~TRINITY_DN6667_c0_g1_i9.p1  ORF type:complete len:238 (-),score=22.32 TRINITY_DN6667_c0_g1_i9:7-720(-)
MIQLWEVIGVVWRITSSQCVNVGIQNLKNVLRSVIQLKKLKTLLKQAEREESVSQRMESQMNVDKVPSFDSTMSYSARKFQHYYDSDVSDIQDGLSPFQIHQLRSQREYVGPHLADVIKEEVEELYMANEDDSSNFLGSSPFNQKEESASQSFSPFERAPTDHSGSVVINSQELGGRVHSQEEDGNTHSSDDQRQQQQKSLVELLSGGTVKRKIKHSETEQKDDTQRKKINKNKRVK